MTKPYYQDGQVTVHAGDCLDVLETLPDNSIDAVVTDPPYGLDFMGKHWDTGAVAFDTAVWRECLRVLKPGGHMAAFGGTRTWHRLAVAVEDAGFEIRDNLAWLYGSGFPKSLDVSKAIDRAAGAEREVIGSKLGRPGMSRDGSNQRNGFDAAFGGSATGSMSTDITAPATDAAKQWQGWGTALKPAFEPIVLARKPIRGTVAVNVVEHGTGALNIDGCRVEGDMSTGSWGAKQDSSIGYHGTDVTGYRTQQHTAGRWPANVLLDPDAAAELDKQSGIQRDGTAVMRNHRQDTGGYGSTIGCVNYDQGYGGEGGASRYFPIFRYTPKAPGTERPTVDGISHPTVKPLELMRWLVRLITPPHGLVLDPFVGTGTTAEAAIYEHKRAIVIEREPTYLPLIVARLTKPMAMGFDFEANA